MSCIVCNGTELLFMVNKITKEYCCYLCINWYNLKEQGVLDMNVVFKKHPVDDSVLVVDDRGMLFSVRQPVDMRLDANRGRILGFAGTWWKITLSDESVFYSNDVYHTGYAIEAPKGYEITGSNVKSMTTIHTSEALIALGWIDKAPMLFKPTENTTPSITDVDPELPF